MGYLDVYLDGSNYGNIWSLFLGSSLVSTDDKVLGSNEYIKLRSNYGKVLGNILVNVGGITLGIDVGTELGYFYVSLYGSNDGNI